jgi:hypothetical protein
MKWYKRDPNAALTGMASLKLEERGAYNTILHLIYATTGRSTTTIGSSRAGAVSAFGCGNASESN